jgi:hypothetical protein
VKVIRYLLAATVIGLLATNVSFARDRHHHGGSGQSANGKSLDSTTGAGPTVDDSSKKLNVGTVNNNDQNAKMPTGPDSKEHPVESKTTSGGPSTNEGSQHLPATEGRTGDSKGGPRDIDTNVTIRPSLDHKRAGKDPKDGKDVKNSLFKKFAIPKGKFAGRDKRSIGTNPVTPARNALGLAIVDDPTPKETNAGTGADNKVAYGTPTKNSIGVTVPEGAHKELEKKDGKGVASPPPTANGTGISGTGMEKAIIHTGAIGGAKLNLAGISGNIVHYKH